MQGAEILSSGRHNCVIVEKNCKIATQRDSVPCFIDVKSV